MDEELPLHGGEEAGDDADHGSEGHAMPNSDASLLALLATLNDRARPSYRRDLIARWQLRIPKRAIEALHPPAVIDSVLFGIVEGVVGDGKTLS